MGRFIAAAIVIAVMAVPTMSSAQTVDATVTLELTSVVYVSPQQVVVEGTLTCDQVLEGELDIVLTGKVHPGTVVPQPQTDVFPFSCSGATAFSVAVGSIRGIKFHVGQKLFVNALYVFCGDTSCDGATDEGTFTVVR